MVERSKSFIDQIKYTAAQALPDLRFMDHLEAVRWHIFRSVIAWLAAVIGIFLISIKSLIMSFMHPPNQILSPMAHCVS